MRNFVFILWSALCLIACQKFYEDPRNVVGQPVKALPTPVLTYPLSGDALKIGINAHPQAPLSLLKPFSRIRVYEPWRYTYTQLGLAMEPSRTGNVNFDTYYATAQAAGHVVTPCVSWKLDWLSDLSRPEWQHEPMNDKDTDPGNPYSYGEWSRYWWQVTARYGRFSWNEQYLRVDSTPRWTNDVLNEKKTGLGTLQYIEPENETNRWWKLPYAQYTAQQTAAMMSAAFDGHKGQMGFGTGIKCADETMKVVLAGSSTIDTVWLGQILDWCNVNRSGSVPFDVINLHHYTNAGNSLSNPFVNLTGPGVCPEADALRERIAGAVAWRNSHMPGKELWITEFGWDTDMGSPQRCEAIPDYDQEDVQAQWIVRGYLEAIAAGVDGIYLYCFANEPSNAGLFAASGLVSSEGTGFVSKKSYLAVQRLVAHLNGYTYDGDYSTPDVRKYKFINDSGAVKFAVWSPTMDGTVVPLQSPGGVVLVTETPVFFNY